METYFIRHTSSVSIDNETRERMWKECRVFVHFPWDNANGQNRRFDSQSTNFEDYSHGARRALRIMKELAENGGYVCAHFAGYTKWMMGFVPTGSKIELCKGKWKPEDLKDEASKDHNGVAIIKTLRLHKARFILPDDCVILQPAQPRQGTIARWPSIGNAIEAIVEGKQLQNSLDTLSPNHQEIMCAEFLRLHEAIEIGLPRLVCILRDVGRTMKDLDIIGIAHDERQILAQVTYGFFDSKDVQEKYQLLQKFIGHDAHLILFCKCEKSLSEKGLTVFPIEEIYNRFLKTKVGEIWFKHIFPKI
jgi:hypothetical protein